MISPPRNIDRLFLRRKAMTQKDKVEVASKIMIRITQILLYPSVFIFGISLAKSCFSFSMTSMPTFEVSLWPEKLK